MAGIAQAAFSSTISYVVCQAGRLLHHRAHRAVLLFRKPDGFFDCRGIDFEAGDDVVDPNCGEHLWRALRLVGLNSHLVTRHFLMIFLPKDSNDVESCAAGQRNCDQFNRLGAGTTGCVVEQQVVVAPGCGDKLTPDA